MFLAALVNVGLNLAVIPTWGAAGAAATTLATEVLLAAWFRWHIRPLVADLGLAESLLRTVPPALLMGAALVFVPLPHVLLAVALGVGIFGITAWLTGGWRTTDLRHLRQI